MDGTDHEIYPMPLFPRLSVSDVGASRSWYAPLGFAVVYSMPAMAHVRYRTHADVLLVADRADFGTDAAPKEGGRRGEGVSIYLTVADESVADVAVRARKAGAETDGPTETGWNTRELVVRDPDGYELVFSEPIDTERSFDSVMGRPDG